MSMKKILTYCVPVWLVILSFLVLLSLLFAFEYRWFKGVARCVTNRAESGTTVNWHMIKDCSY